MVDEIVTEDEFLTGNENSFEVESGLDFDEDTDDKNNDGRNIDFLK